MYPKEPAALVRQQFWTAFGQYMRPVLSASGEKINWINYKTAIKYIRITMQCNNGTAYIAIELSDPDAGKQLLQIGQLLKLKKQFQQICGADWDWYKMNLEKDRKDISTVKASIENVHILNQADWPAMISFFKEKIISFDHFWNEYQFVFQ